MLHGNASTPAPTSRSRTGLVPLNGGPWLDNRLPARGLGCVALGGVGLALVSTAIFPHPDALRWLWATLALVGVLIAVFAGLAASAAWMARFAVQTCPACLCRMPRGATTCPHCHFHPPQEVV
jgi:hypothetical protein